MRSALRKKVPRYPSDWSEFTGGDAIKRAVETVSDELSQRIFGYHMVKLGNLSSQIELTRCAVNHQFGQTPTLSPFGSVVAEAAELPYVENSIDGFLLANELDFAQDPHQILREVDRCLTPSGHIILSGFNPYSLTGLGRFLPIKRDNVLHEAGCYSAHRVKDWLGLLGYEIIEQRNILFSMLFFNQRKRLPTQWHDQISRYLPWCSSVYVILARKRVWPMTTVRPKWKLNPRFSPVGASMRVPFSDK